MRTVDDKKREALLQEASKLVISDYGVLPLHFELSVWAMRKDLTYVGRADQATLAQFVRREARDALEHFRRSVQLSSERAALQCRSAHDPSRHWDAALPRSEVAMTSAAASPSSTCTRLTQ